jgi:hypothetical protein
MGLNRMRDLWMSKEDLGQVFLFRDVKPPEPDYIPEPPRKPARGEDHASPAVPKRDPERTYNATTEQLKMLLDQCLQVISKDPEVALRGRPADWDLWFNEPLLSSIRTSTFPLSLKLRLLAFLAVMLPFLDEREQDRVRMTLSSISADEPVSYGEILTEQDLIHTQWLVRGVRRSKDILAQMDALRRSILRRVPNGCYSY